MKIFPDMSCTAALQATPRVKTTFTHKENVQFSGTSDTFKKRIERDNLVFSNDLKTVFDFYESLPFKTLFQSREDRERIERFMVQKDHADYSRRVLEQSSSGGSFMGRLFQERWNETGLPEEDQKAIWQNSLAAEGLSAHPNATKEDIARLLGQYYSHEADEAVGNNYGVGELSDEAKEDAQKILHSGVAIIANSIQFIQNDPDMARIVRNRQLLTNPTPENIVGALNDWTSLFESSQINENNGGNVHFGARTSYYGKNRHNKRETGGIIALSIVGATIASTIPAVGYALNNWMNNSYTMKGLYNAYKLNLCSNTIEEDAKKVRNFVQTVQRIDKAANFVATVVPGSITLGLSVPVTVGIGALSGLVAEAYSLKHAAREMAKYSINLYDAIEDYPNVKIGNKVHTSGEVDEILKKFDTKNKTSNFDQYLRFKNEYFKSKDLENTYKKSFQTKGAAQIFTRKREIDNKTEETPLLRHIVHLQKEINPESLKMKLPLKFLTADKGAFKFLKILTSDDNGNLDNEDEV